MLTVCCNVPGAHGTWSQGGSRGSFLPKLLWMSCPVSDRAGNIREALEKPAPGLTEPMEQSSIRSAPVEETVISSTCHPICEGHKSMETTAVHLPIRGRPFAPTPDDELSRW